MSRNIHISYFRFQKCYIHLCDHKSRKYSYRTTDIHCHNLGIYIVVYSHFPCSRLGSLIKQQTNNQCKLIRKIYAKHTFINWLRLLYIELIQLFFYLYFDFSGNCLTNKAKHSSSFFILFLNIKVFSLLFDVRKAAVTITRDDTGIVNKVTEPSSIQ